MKKLLFLFPLFVFFISLSVSSAQTFTRINDGPIPQDIGNNQGSSWGDYDNDGFPDIFITHTSGFGNNKPNLLYRNLGNGTFAKVTSGIIATEVIICSGGGGSWGDYDNDGYIDLYTSVADGNNRLYHNDGNGTFTKFENFLGGNSDGGWAEYDNDGFLDMFISSVGGPNPIFRNNGNGTFTKIDTGAIASDDATFMSPSWADFDNDNDMDVFWATAFFDLPGSLRNRFFINQGNGFFTRMDSNAVVLSDDQWTTGASWGDYDNDGNMDLYVTNFNPNSAVNHLYHNNGDGTFTKLSIDPVEFSDAATVGSAWGDFDNDGDLDLLVINEKYSLDVTPPSVHDNFLFRNDGGGNFTRITTGDIVKDGGHTCSLADYDNDGDLDVSIANGSLTIVSADRINYIYSNDGNSRNWVNINCIGTTSNRSAIGTRVKAKAVINGVDVWQMREIAQMSGCHSTSDLRVHLGFGDASLIDSLIIRWPSGLVDTYTSIEVNNFYKAVEGQNINAYYPRSIYSQNSCLDKSCPKKNVDSVLFTTRFFNVYNHQFIAHLICFNSDSTQIDSLTLFDDGLHGDSLANDGLYGGYIPPRTAEDYYTLSVSTFDQQLNKYYILNDVQKFTTVPLIFDNVQYSALTNFRYSIKPFLHNAGSAHTIKNINVELTSSDPWVTLIFPAFRTCANLSPGQIAGITAFAVTYDSATFPGYFNLRFSISSTDYSSWIIDTTIIVKPTDVKEETSLPLVYKLEQNFPNPFNPTTIIGYVLQEKSNAKLILLNALGEEIAVLIDEEQDKGYHKVEFNGSKLSSGVYFYKLQAGSYIETKKMILLK